MPDAFTAALSLLSSRELSEAQLRARLLRKQCDPADVDQTIARLKREGALDDRRVALAAARLEASVRHRGRRRVLQRLQRLGIDAETAATATGAVFEDVDERALLERALDRKLARTPAAALDRAGTARLFRSLVAQGFAPGAVMAALKARRASMPAEDDA